MIGAALLCKVLGHQWRRPRRAERQFLDCRICNRCAATRPVRARAPKGKP